MLQDTGLETENVCIINNRTVTFSESGKVSRHPGWWQHSSPWLLWIGIDGFINE
jgi:hypothetical protein